MKKIVLENFDEGNDNYKINLFYLNREQVEEIKALVSKWNPIDEVKDCIRMCITDANEQRFKAYGTTFEDCLTWLEKQGEQKPVLIIPKFRVGDEIETSNEKSLTITKIDEKGYWSEDLFICDFDEECLWDLVEKKPDVKVEPKYKVGDWVMLDRPVLITKVKNMPCNTHQYWTSDGTWFGNATKSKLWTIEDAKDGDILLTKYNRPFIYNGKLNGDSIGAYGGICRLGDYFLESNYPSNWSYIEGVKPATKEQRDTLFAKMKEAGYEWDNENKELIKINDSNSADVVNNLPKLTDEDIDNLNKVQSWYRCERVISAAEAEKLGNWIKSFYDKLSLFQKMRKEEIKKILK